MRTAVLVSRVTSAAVLSALAAWSFRPAFDAGADLAIAAAVVVPAVVAAVWELTSSLVLQRLNGTAASVLAIFWVVAAATVVTQPGQDVLSGPFRLLTGVLPAEATGPQMAAVAVLAGLTAVVAVHLALRPTRGLLAVLPGLVCLCVAQSLSAGVGPLPVWYVPAFVVASGSLVLLGRVNVIRARLIKGAVVVLSAAAVSSIFVQLGPHTSRPAASAQDLVPVAVQPKQNTNPMAQFLALREGRLLLDISGTASTRVDRVGMVTLTDFDGRAWSPSADYRRAAHQFPSPSAGAAPRRDVTLDVRVATPDSIGWLPRSGWPSRINVAGLGFDDQTGDLVVPAGVRTPHEYRIDTSEPVVSGELLSTDQPASGPGRTGPPLPPDVLGFLDAATSGRTTDLDRLLGVFRTLHDSQFSQDSSDEAQGGNGLYQISALVRNHRGTSEQYASAFAVLCRELGWDARVVLGFKPQWTGAELRISGRDVHAWVEIRFERLGWLPLDPSPDRITSADGRLTEEPQQGADAPSVELPPPHESEPEPGVVPNVDEAPTVSDAGPHKGTVLAALIAAAVVLLVLVLPVANALSRRRALRRGSARRRVLAAWRDAIGVLRASGAEVHERQTTGQVVEAVAEDYRSALWPLAELVDRVAFGPQPVTDDMARSAVVLGDRVREQVRLSTGRRLFRWFDPRPLLPRRLSAAYGQR